MKSGKAGAVLVAPRGDAPVEIDARRDIAEDAGAAERHPEHRRALLERREEERRDRKPDRKAGARDEEIRDAATDRKCRRE